MSDMDPHKANTKADKESGAASGTSKGPTTGAASSESEIKDKPSMMAGQTCSCASTGSCTCAPGQCACPNCPYPPSASGAENDKSTKPEGEPEEKSDDKSDDKLESEKGKTARKKETAS